MPPRANRKACAILIAALFATSLAVFSTRAEQHDGDVISTTSALPGRFTALFSFRAPSAFFTPSATISLTDDKSTYFAARPAAFGPVLPSKGLSGQVWIGNGFTESVIDSSLVTSTEGELGCDDVPGWISREWQRPTDSKSSGQGMRHRPVKDEEEDKVKGKVALLSRGGCSFSEKVKWAQRRGATAVIVGDNIIGGPLVRMYAKDDAANITIPSLFTSHTTAHLLSSLVPLHASGHRPHPISRLYTSPRTRYTAKDHHTLAQGELHATQGHSEPKSLSMWSRELAWRLGYHRSARTYPGDIERRASFASIDGHGGRKSDSRRNELTAEDDFLRAGDRRQMIRELFRSSDEDEQAPEHHGLWVTLTPTNMSTSPFLNTLFVLVVSPLITLGIVYTMLLVRSRIRRRRWRAPKSIVERLPVRIYHTLSTSSSSSSSPVVQANAAAPVQTQATPLLADAEPSGSTSLASQYGSCDSAPHETEKPDTGLAAWKRKYGGRQVECVVCLEEYEDGVSKVMSLPCGHEFHVDCITPWLTTRRRTCPICKGDVVRSLIHDDGATSSSAEEAEGASYDDVQAQAAGTVNNSPTAAMPVPDIPAGFFDDTDDLERGHDQGHDNTTSASSWYSGIQRRIDSFLSSPRPQRLSASQQSRQPSPSRQVPPPSLPPSSNDA